ncbi:MAG: ABC transporter ATP-binding protein [Candidatus Krumholzibacteria bacterium]|nr:ABC transporter ATP-binding protein [Candidatus Krumholzibacteria bacterium]
MDYAVVIDGLSKKFGAFAAVDGISLKVEYGEIFGFLGANGAGKTTAIRMLCGLLQPTSGTGTVNGFDINREYEKIKPSIGYMSQKFSLYGDLTGRENLQFYGTVYGLRGGRLKGRIAELVDGLSLDEFIDRPTGALPVGWRQRIALAAAILHRPRIVFLDEPTGGVDPVFRRRFWEILYRLADDGTNLFVTTHYMDEAEFCSRISIMHRGKIVVVGRPRELVASRGLRNLQETFISLISEQGTDG